MIYFVDKFLIELKKQIGNLTIWSKIQETSFANNGTFKFYFWRKSCFYWRGKPSNKVNTVEEEQDRINITGIGNLMDLSKLMFIDEEYGNLKLVIDGG